ncbi:uncharacterized protein LOC111708774 isoform X2 [Eurytemora carolleeae]|uniref:uncharacterized protein LOC111708774 isoform X2 n=1 Tax=Eurytemora carolleeae TaxID=1294199 RepID=UPI000C783019|nr:uncharacterized protein LOC111708774 isoform X2 [Eurytemora carolleeae]|eukprot:XP_023338013.1 uncharacterized protein LOC111708774 isoform X2 [Eurytemora affinis]
MEVLGSSPLETEQEDDLVSSPLGYEQEDLLSSLLDSEQEDLVSSPLGYEQEDLINPPLESKQEHLNDLLIITDGKSWDQPELGRLVNYRSKFSVDDIISSVVTNSEKSSMPGSISILINYGTDHSHILYSTANADHGCGDTQIWDPFSEVCRDIYCATDLTLVEYECKGTPSNVSRDDVPHVSFPSEEILINMTLELSANNNTLSIDEIIEILRTDFATTLAQDMIIDPNRITNISIIYKEEVHGISRQPAEIEVEIISAIYVLKKSGMWEDTDQLSKDEMEEIVSSVINKTKNKFHIFEIYFIIQEGPPDEKGTDEIVASMANFIRENSFILELGSITVKFVSLGEKNVYTEEQFIEWCRDGDIRNFMSGEFEINIVNETLDILEDKRWNTFGGAGPGGGGSPYDLELIATIKKTGKVYHDSDFIANILFQSNPINVMEANYSGVITICDNRAYINDTFCSRVQFNASSFMWSQDGSLIYEGGIFGVKQKYQRWEYRMTRDGMIEVCVRHYYERGADLITLIESYLSVFLHIVSIILLAFTLLTYSIFGVLRNLPGCNLMCLATSILVSQVVFLAGERSEVKGLICRVVAVFLHFTYLSIFAWNNVMAWDIYKTFGQKTILSHIRSKREHLPQYMTYAYGIPLCIVIFSVTIEYTDMLQNFSIGYGVENCWIGRKQATFIFFCLPMLFVVLTNSVLYVLTVISINYVSSVVESVKHKDRGKSDLFIYIRIFSVLGFTWIFGIIAFFFQEECVLKRIIVFLFVIFNGVQGVFLFVVFTANVRVYNLYIQLFHRIKDRFSLEREVRERVKSQIQRNRNEVQFSISDKSDDNPIKTVCESMSPNPCSVDISRLWSWSSHSIRLRMRKTSNESMTSTATTSSSCTTCTTTGSEKGTPTTTRHGPAAFLGDVRIDELEEPFDSFDESDA